MFSKDTTILIIDDMSGTRSLLKKQLEAMGFQSISEANDGEEAFKHIQESAPKKPVQLIISDWNMPKMNGLDLLAKLKSMPEHKNIPFLMVTAENEAQQILRAVELNVSDYVVKPLTSDKLGEALATAWAKHNPESS